MMGMLRWENRSAANCREISMPFPFFAGATLTMWPTILAPAGIFPAGSGTSCMILAVITCPGLFLPESSEAVSSAGSTVPAAIVFWAHAAAGNSSRLIKKNFMERHLSGTTTGPACNVAPIAPACSPASRSQRTVPSCVKVPSCLVPRDVTQAKPLLIGLFVAIGRGISIRCLPVDGATLIVVVGKSCGIVPALAIALIITSHKRRILAVHLVLSRAGIVVMLVRRPERAERKRDSEDQYPRSAATPK